MRATTAAILLVGSLLGADAINLHKRTDGPARVVQTDIKRKVVTNPAARDRARKLRKRSASYISETLANEETLYFANVTIGTPAQSIRLHIDTGSSDTWVNTPNSTLCESTGSPCKAAGTYTADDSSTYVYLNSDFNITYEDGSGSAGDYATDTVRIGGSDLDKQEIGLGYTSTSDEGILGIGYATNEASVSTENGLTYSNVPETMVSSGLINSVAYSLWLNDLDASEGTILFGGVNTDKWTGSLETVPIIKEDGEYVEFIIALTGIGLNGDSGSLVTGLDSPALLDSGTSLMYLPDDYVTKIYDYTGATYDESEDAAIIDCSYADNDTTIDFTFSSPTISVSMSELVLVAGTENGKDVCILGIGYAGSDTPVLGDTFLRSAYVVFDLSNNEISIAQTNFNSSSNNILEITNGTSGVPSATLVTNAVTSVSVSTETAVLSSASAGTSTSKAGAAARTASPIIGYGAAVAAAGAGILAFAL